MCVRVCGLGVVVSFVKSAQGFILLAPLKGFVAQINEIFVSKERKSTKYC